jgi:hypothetical protein
MQTPTEILVELRTTTGTFLKNLRVPVKKVSINKRNNIRKDLVLLVANSMKLNYYRVQLTVNGNIVTTSAELLEYTTPDSLLVITFTDLGFLSWFGSLKTLFLY